MKAMGYARTVWDPKHIVVGADLSDGEIGEGGLLAIEQARRVATEAGAHVSVLHSARPDEYWAPAYERFERSLDTTDRNRQGPLYGAVEALCDSGVEAELVVCEERAGQAIVKHVLRTEADMVIVGKRVGRSHDLRRMGSVSAYLARNCPCVVSVLKPGSRAWPECVVAATDRGAVGERVVDVAATLASRAGAALHVIHAIQVGMEAQMQGQDAVDAYLRQEREAVRAEVAEQLKSTGYQDGWDLHAGRSSPTSAVLECEKRLAPDVIVMGTVSRGGIPGLLVGNTAERLLGILDCSLVVVKPVDFVCPVALD
jgi:universal stress protein E